jgi:putative redox protein
MLMPRQDMARGKALEQNVSEQPGVHAAVSSWTKPEWIAQDRTAITEHHNYMTDVVASLRWITGKEFVARTGTGHSLVIDVPPNWGGSNAGPFNAELILIALGGCAGMDVVALLGKKRCTWDRLEISLESTLADERPTSLRDYVLTFRAWGSGLTKQDLEDAVALSLEKYCVVAHSLNGRIRRAVVLNDRSD